MPSLTSHDLDRGTMALPNTTTRPTAFSATDRRALFLTSIIGFVSGYAGSQMPHTLPFARTALGLTEGEMSAVFAIVRAVSLFGVLVAMSADTHGRKRPILGAYTVLLIASLATALLPSVPAFVASQAVVRLCLVALTALTLVLIAEQVQPGRRALAIGVYGLAGSLGVGLGLVLLPIAERNESAWRVLFAVATLGLLFVPLLARFLPESRAFVPAPRISFIKALGMGLSRHFWPLAGVSFFVAAFSSPAFDFVLERMINDLAWDTGAARFLLIVFSGLGAVGLLVGGTLADRWGRRPTTVTALVLGLLGGVGFYTLDSGWFLAVSIFIATLGATMLTPSFGAARTELFPTRVRATANAWVTNAAIVGSIGGFAAGAIMIDRIGLAPTVATLGAGLVISIVLVLRLPETRGMDLVRRPTAQTRATTQAPPTG